MGRQVRSLLGQIRPDRQTALFSATMPNKVERLVRDALTSPVRVNVGELGAANEDVRQVRQNFPSFHLIWCSVADLVCRDALSGRMHVRCGKMW